MSAHANLRSNFSVLFASFRMRLTTITRYPGQLVTEIFVPIVFAYMPILLGRASGANSTLIFEANTGTTNYISYMLIGTSVFTLVNFAFWHVAYWLRWEQEAGTLEGLYLAPTHRLWVVGGTALYSCLRGIFTASVSYIIGCLIFRVKPFQGEVLLALAFIVVGIIPLYSLTLVYGAVVLKVKEANALVNLMQWGVSFFMGIFFPIAIFPPMLKGIALLFPPTWMTNGVRSALLGIGFFFNAWYLDLAVLWGFMLITPMFGYWIFTRTERNIRRNEGVGQF
jgi:ABC-2 type transport system permease protein